MPMVRHKYRAGIEYQAPRGDLRNLSDVALRQEFDESRQANSKNAHRRIATEIARRDPADRRAAAAI